MSFVVGERSGIEIGEVYRDKFFDFDDESSKAINESETDSDIMMQYKPRCTVIQARRQVSCSNASGIQTAKEMKRMDQGYDSRDKNIFMEQARKPKIDDYW